MIGCRTSYDIPGQSVADISCIKERSNALVSTVCIDQMPFDLSSGTTHHQMVGFGLCKRAAYRGT